MLSSPLCHLVNTETLLQLQLLNQYRMPAAITIKGPAGKPGKVYYDLEKIQVSLSLLPFPHQPLSSRTGGP